MQSNGEDAQLQTHLVPGKEHFFAREQCGFRKQHSTVDHILTLDTVVRSAFKKKQHVGVILFDIEAAYDTTWHHGILIEFTNAVSEFQCFLYIIFSSKGISEFV